MVWLFTRFKDLNSNFRPLLFVIRISLLTFFIWYELILSPRNHFTNVDNWKHQLNRHELLVNKYVTWLRYWCHLHRLSFRYLAFSMARATTAGQLFYIRLYLIPVISLLGRIYREVFRRIVLTYHFLYFIVIRPFKIGFVDI